MKDIRIGDPALGATPLEQELSTLEAYRTFPHIARLIEPSKGGRPVHPATITRYAMRGVRAADGTRIKLRAVRFPSGWRTTLRWFHEFIDAITTDRMGAEKGPPPRPDSRRDRELGRLESSLEKDGY